MTEQRTLLRGGQRAARRAGLPLVVLALLWGPNFACNAATVPTGFEKYAKTDVGEGLECVVGDVTDEDAMNGRAYIYLEDSQSHSIRWVARVPLRPHRYQNRATHCLSNGREIYALIQSDTSQAQALSQTFVDVVTLDRTNGRIELTEKIIAKEAGRTPSTWIEAGPENFRRESGKIVVKGKYFDLQNPATRKSFTASPTP